MRVVDSAISVNPAMWKRAWLVLLVVALIGLVGCESERSVGSRADLTGYVRVVVLPVTNRTLAAALQRTLAEAGFNRIAASAEALHRDTAFAAATLICEARTEGASSTRVRLRLSDYATGATRYVRVMLAGGPSGYAEALRSVAGDLAR